MKMFAYSCLMYYLCLLRVSKKGNQEVDFEYQYLYILAVDILQFLHIPREMYEHIF